MPEALPHIGQVIDACDELDRRAALFAKLEQYVSPGGCPIPQAIAQAQVTQAYRMLMAFAQTNYAPLIVRSARSLLHPGGIRNTGSAELDTAAWGIWQANKLDAEARLAHDAILTHGRAFAIAWPTADGESTITIEDPATTIVEYVEGSRYVRAAGLRRWIGDDKRPHATLYRPDGIWKFSGPKNSSGSRGTSWEPRTVEGEDWPLKAPAENVVPVVEIATNRRLKATRYGYAEGDFENVLGLLDRINVLEFLRLVIAFTAGFPIRAVIGDKILKDDEGNDLAPFKLAVDVVAQFENPNVKITEIAAADLKSFGEAIDRDTQTLSGLTSTPAYFLRSVPIQNVSADAIRAADLPRVSKAEDHKLFLGEGWEEVLRTAGLVRRERLELGDAASLVWLNRESRSLAERADAATKLKDVLPWQAVAEIAFDATQDDITRWQSMVDADSLGQLVRTDPAQP